MIKVDVSTSKQQLLEKLAISAEEKGDLVLSLTGLPTFLTTHIAFTVFNYQISNYPRKILWTSENQELLNFLIEAEVPILPQKVADPNALSVQSQVRDVQILKKNISHKDQPFQVEPALEKNITTQVILPEFSPQKQQAKINQQQVKPETIKQKKFLSKKAVEKTKPEISAKSLLSEKQGYKQSSLIASHFSKEKLENSKLGIDLGIDEENLEDFDLKSEKVKNNKKEENYVNNVNQDLDSWLERIDSTRESLEKLNISQTFGLKPKKKKNKFNPFKNRFVNYGLGIFLFVSLVVGIVLFFPTRVYTIDLTPISKERTADIKIPVSDFGTDPVALEASAIRELDTNATQVVDRSIGQVRIVNSSGSTISFDREGIFLIANNGNSYRQVAQAGDPFTFRLTPGSSVEITIQATANGESYNLERGEVLRITNLKNASLGNRISATVLDKINNVVTTTDKIVTQENLNSLKAQVRDDFSKKAEQEVAQKNQTEVFALPGWYKDYSPEYTFNQEVGAIAENVEVKARADTEIYYLNKFKIEEYLKQNFSEIDEVNEVSLNSSEGSFGSVNNLININLDFVFLEKPLLDKQFISSTLANKEFEEAETDLRRKYPAIQSISENKSGIEIPGLPSRINLEIEEE